MNLLSLERDENVQVGALLSINFIRSPIFQFFFLKYSQVAGRGGGTFKSCAVTKGVVPECQFIFRFWSSLYFFLYLYFFVIFETRDLFSSYFNFIRFFSSLSSFSPWSKFQKSLKN